MYLEPGAFVVATPLRFRDGVEPGPPCTGETIGCTVQRREKARPRQSPLTGSLA
jgi:hypothetical protein